MNRFKRAIDRGDLGAVRKMLTKAPDLARRPIRWGSILCPCKSEPLHYLSDGRFNRVFEHQRHVDIARCLLEAGAPVNGSPDFGESPLHGAASLGEPGIAAVLLEFGADAEARASYPGIPNGTPLGFAVHFGMVEVIEVLVSHGAELLSPRMFAGAGRVDLLQDSLDELSPAELRDAYRCGAVCDRTDVVDVLLERLDINAEVNEATALHWAAWEAKPRMVAHLVARGADPTRRDAKHRMTPLGWAQHRGKELGPRWGHGQVVALLSSS